MKIPPFKPPGNAKRIRLVRIDLCDFQAFPGPGVTCIDLLKNGRVVARICCSTEKTAVGNRPLAGRSKLPAGGRRQAVRTPKTFVLQEVAFPDLRRLRSTRHPKPNCAVRYPWLRANTREGAYCPGKASGGVCILPGARLRRGFRFPVFISSPFPTSLTYG